MPPVRGSLAESGEGCGARGETKPARGSVEVEERGQAVKQKDKQKENLSASRKKPVVKVQCDICGETFEACARARRCARCRKLVAKFYNRQTVRLAHAQSTHGMENALEYAVRMAREEVGGETASVQQQEGPRCLYCGNPLTRNGRVRKSGGPGGWDAKGGYCGACRFYGLDNVHRVTGSTNGWDRKRA